MNNLVITVEYITPRMAMDYLDKNPEYNKARQNRKVVDSYVISMKRGEWMLNGETIKFDYTGKLVDGQHRLMAVAKSGCTVPFVVVRGCEPESFTTVDCGLGRNSRQLLKMKSVKNAGIISGAVRIYLRLDSGVSIHSTVGSKLGLLASLSNKHIIEVYDSNTAIYDNAASFVWTTRSALGRQPAIPMGTLAGIYVYLIQNLGYDEAYVKKFFSGVFSYDSNSDLRIERLRKKYLQTENEGARKLSMEYKIIYLIKTWNACATGRTLGNLSYDPDRESNIKFLPKPLDLSL